jgi:tellurite resistance protein TerB
MAWFGIGKKTAQARAAMGKLENRDLMQAIVYGSVYVAAADGELSVAELDKIEMILGNTPQLQGYGAELSNLMDRAKKDFAISMRVLRQNAEKELGDLQHSPNDALTVLNIMLTIAESGPKVEGEDPIDKSEMAALERAAKLLGLNLKDHL